MTEATLRDTVLRIGEDARASAVAVAVYDFEHHTTWSINPARWFHAASTIKVPVLLGVYDAIEQHRFDPNSRAQFAECPAQPGGLLPRKAGADNRDPWARLSTRIS